MQVGDATAASHSPKVAPDRFRARWSMVEDPDALRRFVAEVVDRHHRVVLPGVVADHCSCGRPFMLCSIAPLVESLMGSGAQRPARGGLGGADDGE